MTDKNNDLKRRDPRGSDDKDSNKFGVKKLTRGPIVWIVLAIVIVSIGMLWLSGGGYQRIDTKQGLELLNGKTVEQIKVVDGDQRVDMVLTENSHANLQKEYSSISYSIEHIRPTSSKLISIIFNYLLQNK